MTNNRKEFDRLQQAYISIYEQQKPDEGDETKAAIAAVNAEDEDPAVDQSPETKALTQAAKKKVENITAELKKK